MNNGIEIISQFGQDTDVEKKTTISIEMLNKKSYNDPFTIFLVIITSQMLVTINGCN